MLLLEPVVPITWMSDLKKKSHSVKIHNIIDVKSANERGGKKGRKREKKVEKEK